MSLDSMITAAIKRQKEKREAEEAQEMERRNRYIHERIYSFEKQICEILGDDLVAALEETETYRILFHGIPYAVFIFDWNVFHITIDMPLQDGGEKRIVLHRMTGEHENNDRVLDTIALQVFGDIGDVRERFLVILNQLAEKVYE